MKNRIAARLWYAWILVAVALVLPFGAQTANAAGTAKVRIVHASPDAPAVDVYLNDKPVAKDLTFTKATAYLPARAGKYRIRVTPAGAGLDKAVIDAQADLRANRDYTVVAIGKLAEIKPLLLTDENRPPAAGKATLRVVHAVPEAPPVDVAVTGGAVLIPNLPFGSASRYVPVKAGTYDLEVRGAGSKDVVLKIPGFKAMNGKVYTVFAMGQPMDLRAIPLVDFERR